MRSFRFYLVSSGFLFYFSWLANGLKCRAATESQQGNDFEYIVRLCLRHMKNESDALDLYSLQNFDSSKSSRHEMSNNYDSNNNNNNNNNENRNYRDRNRGISEGFDRFSHSNPSNDRNRYGNEEDRNRQENEYEESDYFGSARNGRKKFKGRPKTPHSYQQQLQHDRDSIYGRGNRDQSYFYSNKNKNKVLFNNEKNNESPLADIDPCVVHCIFQEMQLLDETGKPNKGLISQRMTQRIRNSELKNFIQESVEECFDSLEDDDFTNNNNNNNYNNHNNQYKRPKMGCEWAKAFAMCLETRGKDNCEDWDEPIQRNHNNNNNNNNNMSENGKTNQDQRHKSKQNDRG